MLKGILVVAAVVLAGALPSSVNAQIVKCVGKDGKTYVGSSLAPQCAGQAASELNKQGQVVKRTDAMLTPEQRATREAEEKARKEHDAEAARKEQEETRKNKALLSTYGSEKDIEVARTRALADNQSAVKQTQDRIAQIQKVGDGFKKELEFYSGKTKPPAKLTQDIQNNAIDLKAQQDLMAAKKKEVDGINARYDEDKRRYLELTKGPGAFPAAPPAPSAKK